MTIFVAGSTGSVGRAVVRLAAQRSVAIFPHTRRDGGFPLDDAERLIASLAGCATIVQLIGTMRSRFGTGDTYESSDIGTTRLLVDAAKRAGTIEHVVLLSSVGAGRPVGAYLRAKAAAEELVQGSGIAWTILRPSSFDGEGHKAPPGMGLLTRLPGLASVRPIPVDTLAGKLLDVAVARAPLGEILQGAALFR
jgi:uncharacterized protein YbjT (DUF2867 family)